MRRALIIFLWLPAGVMAYLAVTRAMLPYNENDVYFDGKVTYHRNAVVAYAALSIAFACLGVAGRWYNASRGKNPMK